MSDDRPHGGYSAPSSALRAANRPADDPWQDDGWRGDTADSTEPPWPYQRATSRHSADYQTGYQTGSTASSRPRSLTGPQVPDPWAAGQGFSGPFAVSDDPDEP